MGCKQFIINLKSVLILLGFIPFFVIGQNYPRFELYQLKQGTDSGQFIVTGLDSNLAFNNILRFRSADSTFLIGTDTVAVKSDIASSLLLYVDRVELGDSLLLYVDRTELGDSLALYPNRIELGDTANNIRLDIPTYISDSLVNYASRTELGDSLALYPNRTELADTALAIRNSIPIQIGDSLTNYATKVELGDTALAIRLDIPTYISDSLTNYVSRVELGDTSNNIRTSITSEIADSLVNYPNRVELGDTASAIRTDIPTYISDSLVNYVSRVELGDSLDLYPNRTELADTALAIRADFPAAGGDVTTAQLADTASAIRADIPTLPITLGTQTNGNYIATGGTSGNGISGTATGEGSTFTVTSNATNNNTANTIVFRNASGNFSAGTITAALSGNSSTATKLQTARTISLTSDVTGSASFDGSADASITATVVDDSHNHIISNVDFLSDSLSALRTAINAAGGGGLWSNAATAGEIYYNGGNVAIGNTDPDYPLHVTGRGYFTDDLLVFDRIYIGSDFNHISGSYAPYIDRYAGTGETGMDFYAYMSNSSFPLYRFIDSYDSYSTVFQLNPAASTYQAVINGKTDLNGNLTQSGTIVQDGGTVTFNNTQSGSYDFGVGSLNHLPFMWVDASADKMAVGGGTPAYTLDVTGDINFTGDLYDDGVLFSGGGSEEYVFTGQFKSKTDMYIALPSNVYTCTIDQITFASDFYGCSSCNFVFSTGYLSSNTYTSSNTLWTYTPAGASGLLRNENTVSQTINSTNNILNVTFNGTVAIDWLHTSIVVTCN